MASKMTAYSRDGANDRFATKEMAEQAISKGDTATQAAEAARATAEQAAVQASGVASQAAQAVTAATQATERVTAVEGSIGALARKDDLAAVDTRVKAVEAIPPAGVRTYETVADLMKETSIAALPKTILTVGHDTASDGAGLVLTNESWTPAADHVYGRIAIPIGGRWAIPRNVPTSPMTNPVKAAVDAMLARAKTYHDAGTALEWNEKVLTPLHQGGPTRTPSGKWGLTCSSYVGMVLSGLAYQDTTYVAESNVRKDPRVQWGRLVNTDPWQAYRMARWAFVNGDVWIPVAKDWQPGDVLFWGKQNPEGPGTTGKYFLNIYHVGIYAGGGMLYQTKSASDPQGVMYESIDGMPDEIVLAWRPMYNTPVGSPTTGGGTVDLSAYITRADAQGLFADRAATSTALNNRYPKADSDARYAQKGELATLAPASAVEAERTARTQDVARVEGLVSAERTAWEQAVAAEAQARTQAVAGVEGLVTAETRAREQAITGVDAKVTQEASARAEAVEAERTAREQAVSAVVSRVQALEGNAALTPARNRVEVGRVLLNTTPVQVANGQSGFDVTFARPFDTPPRVIVSVGKTGDPSGTLRASTGEPTTTGVRIWVAGSTATGWVDWFATDGTQLPVGP